jgi:hypothetical protein
MSLKVQDFGMLYGLKAVGGGKITTIDCYFLEHVYNSELLPHIYSVSYKPVLKRVNAITEEDKDELILYLKDIQPLIYPEENVVITAFYQGKLGYWFMTISCNGHTKREVPLNHAAICWLMKKGYDLHHYIDSGLAVDNETIIEY